MSLPCWPMKKCMVLLIAGVCLASLVSTASNKAQIEKLDPGGGYHLQDFQGEDLTGLVMISREYSFKYKNDLQKLEAIVPEPIVMDPLGALYQDWKPFGQVNTKYHASWLFNPDKIC